MDASVQIALVGVVSGLLTLCVGELFRRWRSGSDLIRDLKVEADTLNVTADAEHKTMEALTDAFRAIADRQAGDISDLQDRLRRVEDALLVAQQRNEALEKENSVLRHEVERLRSERDTMRLRAELAEGENRNLTQLSQSGERLYKQDALPEDDEEPTP